MLLLGSEVWLYGCGDHNSCYAEIFTERFQFNYVKIELFLPQLSLPTSTLFRIYQLNELFYLKISCIYDRILY